MKRAIRVRRHLRMGGPVRAHWMAVSSTILQREVEAARLLGMLDKRKGRPMEMAKELHHTWAGKWNELSDEQKNVVLDEYGKAYNEA